MSAFHQIRALFIVTILIVPLPLEGQERSTSLRKIIVFPSSGEARSGRLLRVDEESITLLSARSEERLAFSEISRVLLGGEGRGRNHGALMGAILGGYLSTLAFSGGPDRRDENGHFLPANSS